MSLTSVAAPIWNEIAQTQHLKTAWARKAFALDGQGMAELEDQEWKALKAKSDSETASALMNVKPLILENVAIAKFTQDHPSLRKVLPEVVSISEALILASQDYPLNRKQQARLRELLKATIENS